MGWRLSSIAWLHDGQVAKECWANDYYEYLHARYAKVNGSIKSISFIFVPDASRRPYGV